MSDKDTTYNKIICDETILQYGMELVEKHERKIHLRNFIPNKLREIGKFTIKVEKININRKTLKDIYRPEYFETTVE